MVPGMAVADDEYPDSCGEPQVLSGGEYAGAIDSPLDRDKMILTLDKGEYYTVEFVVPESASEFRVDYTQEHRGDPPSIRNITNARSLPAGEYQIVNPSAPMLFQIWGNEDNSRICLWTEGGESVPYEWRMSLTRNEPTPDGIEVTQLRERIDQQSQRISELESSLEAKNQTIRELQAQPTDGSAGDVTIDVTVNPADGQENFVLGGEALINAESENADVTDMQVTYQGGTYQLDSSGEVTIPLADTGTQELTLIYGDTTKQVSIDVESQRDQGQQQNQQNAPATDSNSPGFGVIATVIAILGSMLLFTRMR
jgi:PGF-CTERM protein